MDIIQFIEQDAAKAESTSSRTALWSLLLFTIPLCLGLGLRRDTFGLFSLPIVVSSVLMLGMISTFPMVFSANSISLKKRLWIIGLGFSAIAVLSLWRQGFPFGTIYETHDAFLREAENCFFKGLLTSALVSLITSLLVLKYYPLPSKVQRFALGFLGGICGIVMLNLHCPSAHVGHLFLGHWLPMVIVFLASYATQSFILAHQIKNILGERIRSLKRLSKIA